MARTQVRLALVIEGGVSLAVWMSGVVQEIDLLRRAGAPGRARPAGDQYEGSSYGLWRELCDRLDVDVVVDVVCGTSAGGLNGALLACATAGDTPLPSLRELWLDQARLTRGKLLHREGRSALSSVLDGGFFEQQLLGVIGDAIGGTGQQGGPVTLLTTATALGEQFARWKDSSGQAFDVADHRRVYRFRNDPKRVVYRPPTGRLPQDLSGLFPLEPVCDLVPEQVRTLARAARATAGFPGAFAPVAERGDGADLTPYRIVGPCTGSAGGSGIAPAYEAGADGGRAHEAGADGGRAHEAGADRAGADGARGAAFLVDGGVLDNAPFEPLLAEFARREVDQDWRRVIGYIVANDALATSTVVGETKARKLRRQLALGWFPVLSSALRMPSEISFRHGVEALAQRSLDAARLIAAPQEMLRAVLEEDELDVGLLRQLYPQYRRSRLASGVVTAYLVRSREAAVHDVTLPKFGPACPDVTPSWVPGPDLPEALAGSDYRWGTAVADRSVRLLLSYVKSLVAPGDSPQRRRHVDEALAVVSATASRVAAVRDVVEDRIAAASPAQGVTADGSMDADAGVLAAMVEDAVSTARCPEVLQKLLERAAGVLERLNGRTASQVMQALLAVEILTQATAGPVPFTRMARFDLVRMGPDVDTPVVPAIPSGGNGACRPFGAWKLYGTQLGHFGAFGNEQWRVNDYVWGRLDGAAHLARILAGAGRGLQGDPPADIAQALRMIQRAVLAEERVSAEGLQASLRMLDGLNARTAIDEIRSSRSGEATAVDTVSDLMRVLRFEGEGVPALIGEAGNWVSTVLAPRATRQPRLTALQWIVRGLSTPWPRHRFWRWVCGPDKRVTRWDPERRNPRQ